MKKKGLIISTVVMVVVLIASLTTATYAWFTATAQATVDDMTINSMASDGLQISVYDGTKWYNGDVTTSAVRETPAQWTGTTEGYGSNVSFTTDSMKFYGVSGNGFDMYTAGRDEVSVEGNVAQKLYKASENFDYFSAVLGVQLTSTSLDAAKDIYGAITVTANGAMATTARIAVFALTAGKNQDCKSDITDGTKWTLKYVLAPFGQAQQAGPTWTNDGTTANNYLKLTDDAADKDTITYTTGIDKASNFDNGTFSPSITVDSTAYTNGSDVCEETAVDTISLGQLQAHGDYIYIKVVIWFEGEDPQCVTANAGTGMTVGIVFSKAE